MSEVLSLPNRLKQKAGNGEISQKSIKNAQEIIEDNKIDFAPIARRHLSKIDEILEANKKDICSDTVYFAILNFLDRVKVESEIFNFPSIVVVTDAVFDFFENRDTFDEDSFDVFLNYKKAVETLISKGIKDEHDPVCKSFAEELHSACKRCLSKNIEGYCKQYMSGMQGGSKLP